jgi:thioredoxin 1
VTTKELEMELQDCSTPIFVDFMADWCGPCQSMAPQLEEVAKNLEGKVRFFKVDSDVETEAASTLQISGLPTCLLINDMSVIMRAEGALMADEIEQLVRWQRHMHQRHWVGAEAGCTVGVRACG